MKDNAPLVKPSDDRPAPRPKAKAKPQGPAIQKARQKMLKKEDSAPIIKLIEEELPKPKKRAQIAKPNKKQEDAKNILRASRRADADRAKAKQGRFTIASPPEPVKRRAQLDDDLRPISRLRVR